jgi:hypothetical protein
MTTVRLFKMDAASSTLGTAGKLFISTGATGFATDKDTRVGTASGWGQVYGRGTTGAWPALAAPTAPDGNGWVWDDTTLEGQALTSGSWNFSWRFAVTAGSIVADLMARLFLRRADGTYIPIGTALLAGQSITTSFASYDLNAVQIAGSLLFQTGDKLYADYWLRITSNSTGSGTADVQMGDITNNGGTVGWGSSKIDSTDYAPPAGPFRATYEIKVRDNNRNLVGQLDAFDKATLVPRFNQVGEWSIQLDASHPMAPYLATPTYGIVATRSVVDRNGLQVLSRVEMSGPTRRIQRQGKQNLLIVSGKDDLAWLSARDAYPVVTAPDYATAVLADSPLRYYKCNEPSGATATDASGHQNGTINGGVSYSQGSLVDDVASNTSLLLNGSTGRIDVPNAGLPTGASPWTIYLWTRLPASNPGVDRYPFAYGSTNLANQFAYMRMHSDGTIQAGILNATGGSSSNLPSPPRGVARLYALRFNGTVVDWFQDGVKIASMTPTSPSIAAGPALVFGALTNDASTWTDRLDECVFVGSALSDDRIAFLYELGRSRFAGSAYDTRTGVCETILRQYVDLNAISAVNDLDNQSRVVSGLALLADGARGSTVTGNARFDPLMTKDSGGLLQLLARASNPALGFKVVQNGTALNLTIYQPADKTSNAKFSMDLGNLADFDYVIEAPDLDSEGNAVIVGGGGEGAARIFESGFDTTSIGRWGRGESFVDARDTSEIATLAQRRDEALAASKERTSFTGELAPVASMIFGFDYDLGDKVTALIDGSPITDIIREVRIELDGKNAETITPTIGSVDAQQIVDANTNFRRQQAQTQTRNGRLERRQ